jgi:predicted DNA-binding antitoxin AbrB/MazE fold protein
MPKVIHPIYENGVFKPVDKIDLSERQQVEIVLQETASATRKTQGILKGLDSSTIDDLAWSPEFLSEES